MLPCFLRNLESLTSSIIGTFSRFQWFTSAGFSKTQNLRAAVAEQADLNDQLQRRNLALEAEVVNLKQSSEAAEERARTDLGMIGREETFYQVVPATHSSL